MTDQRELEVSWTDSNPKTREGEKPSRWSDEERQKFQAGLVKFGLQDRLGPGGAELMAAYMGNRSVLQIKSHWQHLPNRAGKTVNSKGKRPKPCAACRKAKIKCGGVGNCSRCQTKGIPCVADSEDLVGGLTDAVEQLSAGQMVKCGKVVSEPEPWSWENWHRCGQCFLVPGSPERPLMFSGSFNGLSQIVPPADAESPWPKSLVRMFKLYRVADDILLRILNNMTPKLLSTLLYIFRAVDRITVQKEPAPVPKDWAGQKPWQSSLRCGMQA
eukprot:1294306-Rhodomonas_salina.1